MPEPIELLPPGTGPHDEAWHELRSGGVTASEIAAVMGISPYESPFSLYWRKVNGWQFEGNEYTRAGQHLEATIADWWIAEHDPIENLDVERAGLYAHAARPWQLATPDRLLFLACEGCEGAGWGVKLATGYTCRDCDARPPVSLIECKWVAHSWDGWGEQGTDQVPVHYRAQCLWQLDVMGVDEVHVAALGPGGFRSYLVRRDEADLALMRTAGAEFYRRLVEGDPPPLDSHAATLGALKKLYPTTSDGELQVGVDLAERYRAARKLKSEAEGLIDLCEAKIRAALGSEHGRAMCNGKLVASRSIYERKGYEVKPTTIDKLTPGRADSYDHR